MNKKSRDILIFLLLIITFFIVTFTFSSDKAINMPDYTVFSSDENGSALVMDSLKNMGFPVGVYNMFIDNNTDINDIQIIIVPDYRYFTEEKMQDIADWVLKGGILIYFESDQPSIFNTYLDEYFQEAELSQSGYFYLYKHGMGKAYIASSEMVNNKSLMDNNGKHGSEIAALLLNLNYNNIYFNESYHGYAPTERLWDNIPFNIKLIVYQFIILTIVCVGYFGKRFGKPLPYYEEIEREENEYVYTLSNLYLSVGMGESISNAYLEKFLSLSRRYFSIGQEPSLLDIYPLWKEYKLDNIEKLEYLIENIKKEYNTKNSKEKKDLLKVIGCFKSLTDTIKKS